MSVRFVFSAARLVARRKRRFLNHAVATKLEVYAASHLNHRRSMETDTCMLPPFLRRLPGSRSPSQNVGNSHLAYHIALSDFAR